MPARTLYLARLIGLFCIIVAIALLANESTRMDLVTGVLQNHVLMILFGMLSVAAGLALVLGHNVWSGGVAPVVVTIFGWITLIRGAVLLVLPVATLNSLYASVDFEKFFYIPFGIVLIVGLYLTYAGFMPAMPRAKSSAKKKK